MSEDSRSRVTKSLGRIGKMIRLGDCDQDHSSANMHPVAERKRSLHEMHGDYTESSDEDSHERRYQGARSSGVGDEDLSLSKSDLRHKIMKRHRQSQSHDQPQDLDLRNILSRRAQSPEYRSLSEHLKPNSGRKQHADIRDDRDLLSVSRHSRRSETLPYPQFECADDPRQHIPQTSDNGCGYLEKKDVRYRVPCSRGPSMSCDPGMSVSNGISTVEPGTESYPPWNSDWLRKRSPKESFGTSSSVIAPKRDEIPQYRCPPSYDCTKMDGSGDAYEISRSQYMPELVPSIEQMRTHSISQMEPRTDSYSPWTPKQLGRRSLNENFGASSGVMGPRIDDIPQYAYPLRYAGSKTDGSGYNFEISRTQSNIVEIPQYACPLGYAGSKTDGSGYNFEISRTQSNIVETPPYAYPLNYSGTNMAEFAPPMGHMSSTLSMPSSLPHSGLVSQGVLHAVPYPHSLPQSAVIPHRISDMVPCPPLFLQPGVVPQRSSHAVDDQDSVDSFLRSLGLERFILNFEVEEVDMFSLKRMSESDLAVLGIPMGPRKKIFSALQPRLRLSLS